MSEDTGTYGVVQNVAGFVLDLPVHEPVPLGLNNCFVYCIQVGLRGSALNSLVFLIHREKFTEEQLRDMADRAAAKVLEVRIVPRRSGLRLKDTSKEHLEKINNDYFQTDMQFFEAVMADSFDFRVLKVGYAKTHLPTNIEVHDE